ncbi:MAG: outer membrane beta-barrel protein [Pirellulales bacterium]|nr:outer membrane beta-barrel protein [Pirellulales bacterium]
MRIHVLAMLVVAMIVSGPAWAGQLSQPDSVRQVAFNFDDSAILADGGDLAISATADVTPAKTPLTNGYNSCGTCDPCDTCCDPCGSRCGGCGFLDRYGITAGGWLQVGATGNSENPADGYNGPLMTNDLEGKLQMNELWFYLERAIHPECGFDIGGRIDLLYGTDWRVADWYGNGLEDRMNRADSLYGISLPQMYVEAGLGRLSVKMGRMTGILGYESLLPINNFFYSHSYTYFYGEPILITGMMGKYKLSEQTDLLAGFHNGYHQFENDNGEVNFEGGVKWHSFDKRTSLAYCIDVGRNDIDALRDQYVQSIVFQRQLNCRWQYVFQTDYGFENSVTAVEDSEWYSICQYLIYKINSRWSAGMRIEWFRDDDGTRVYGLGNLPDAQGWMGQPGYAGSFTDLTAGLNWKPRHNMMLRPEIRWDWFSGPANPNGAFPYPYDDGTSKTQFTAACDFVMTF